MREENIGINFYMILKWIVLAGIALLVVGEVIFGIIALPSAISSFLILSVLALTNILLWLMYYRRINTAPLVFFSLLLDTALTIVALYFNGGTENTWLFLPGIIILLAGFIIDLKASILLAVSAYFGVILMFLLDYNGIIPHYSIYEDVALHWRDLEYNLDYLTGMFLLYLACALGGGFFTYYMKRVSNQLKQSLEQAQQSQTQAENSRRAIQNILEDLSCARNDLEQRVRERTQELEESRKDLEKKIEARTVDLENSRKAIMHMMRDLKEDMSKLQAIDRLKTEFLSLVSHELRTPITPIKGYLALMLGGKMGDFSDQQKHALNILMRQSDHLEDLIGSVLDISRLELGKPIPAELQPLSIKKMIDDIIEALKLSVEERGLRLSVEIPGPLPTIMGDEIKLKRVMTNLIGNSLKFTPKGGWITIKAGLDGTNIKIEVVDNGIGIAREYLEKIFAKFFQIDSSYSRAAGGIGMGLAIAKELIELHGGKLWAESPGLGRGASFIFTLPVEKRGGA
ncbi:MAG: hypothetical protein JW782_04395 [Candidatus Saganbacteria bacterium]|nr:hypothetical protein [Candidatus Saganbacteria bacterium]